jgi:hypothetical protein
LVSGRFTPMSNGLEMYGLMFIHDLIRAIPQSGLAKVLSAYLKSELSQFPLEDPDQDIEEEALSHGVSVPSDETLGEMMVFKSKANLNFRTDTI